MKMVEPILRKLLQLTYIGRIYILPIFFATVSSNISAVLEQFYIIGSAVEFELPVHTVKSFS